MAYTLNDENWQARETTERPALVQVRDNEVKVGAYYIYRGKSTLTNATYLARVEKITRWLFVLEITIDQSTDFGEEAKLGRPKKYTWAIQRTDLGHTERLYRRE